MVCTSDITCDAPAAPPALGSRRLAAWAAAAWASVIFGMSQLPGSAVPGRFGSLAHFIEYAVLGALIAAAVSDGAAKVGPATRAIALASAWGATDELHQAFVIMRTPDHMDWLLDSAGAALGALAFVMATQHFRRGARLRRRQ